MLVILMTITISTPHISDFKERRSRAIKFKYSRLRKNRGLGRNKKNCCAFSVTGWQNSCFLTNRKYVIINSPIKFIMPSYLTYEGRLIKTHTIMYRVIQSCHYTARYIYYKCAMSHFVYFNRLWSIRITKTSSTAVMSWRLKQWAVI